MAGTKANTMTVRIPVATYDTLVRLLNSEATMDAKGHPHRLEAPFGTDELSSAQIVNTALLAYLSSSVDPEVLSTLLYSTPRVSKSRVVLAAQRLVPERAVIVPADIVAKLMKEQRQGFDDLKNDLALESKRSKRRFGFLSNMCGSILRGIGFLIGFSAPDNVGDRKTFEGPVTRSAIHTLGSFGQVVQQHEESLDEATVATEKKPKQQSAIPPIHDISEEDAF